MIGKKWKKLLKIWVIGCMIGMFGLVTGCSGSGGGKPLALEEVHQKLQQMQSYETEAKITFSPTRAPIHMSYCSRQKRQDLTAWKFWNLKTTRGF